VIARDDDHVLDRLSSICHRTGPSLSGSGRYRVIIIDTDVVLESWLL
jgi:hypothetical protein